MKNNKPSKKQLEVRIQRLTDQYADLNSRLNQLSYDKVKQGIQLDQLGDDNQLLQQRLGGMEEELQQISAETDLSESAVDTALDPKEVQDNLAQLVDQYILIQTDLQDLRSNLDKERQSLKSISDKADDLRCDADELTSHIRHLEESGSEISVHDSEHSSQIHALQGTVAELTRKLQEMQSERKDSEQVNSEALKPLQEQFEQFKQKIAEQHDQNQALETRMSDLANSVDETAALVLNTESRFDDEHTQVEGIREAFESRISGLESLVDTLQSGMQGESPATAAEGLLSTKEELSRELADLNVRLTGAESLLSQQRNTANDQLRQLRELTDKIAEQSRRTEVFKHLTAALQDDSAGLKENATTLSQRLQETGDALRRDEDAQEQLNQQLATLEQRLTALQTQQDQGMQSLSDQFRDLTGQVALNKGLALRLDSLDSSMESQFRKLESKQQQLAQNDTEHHERLSLQENTIREMVEEVAGLQSGQQHLIRKSEKQSATLEIMGAENDKQRVESEKLIQQVSQIRKWSKSLQAIGFRQTLAIAGVLGFSLLASVVTYLLVAEKIADMERDLTVKLIRQGEIYVTHQEMDEQYLSQAVAATQASGIEQIAALDAQSVQNILDSQKSFMQRLAEIEEQLAASAGTRSSMAETTSQEISEQTRTEADQVDGSVSRLEAAWPGSNVSQAIEERFAQMEAAVFAVQLQLEKLVGVSQQDRSRQDALVDDVAGLNAALAELKQQYQQAVQPPASGQTGRKQRNSVAYSIQLVGVSNKESILSFAHRHAVRGERAYMHTVLEGGRDWYVLLYGQYDTYREARHALELLPESLQAQQPWIRKVPTEGTLTAF